MKLPKDLSNDFVLRTWMAQRKRIESKMKSASFVSPMWKQNSDIAHPHAVTLSLRPFRTTKFCLDSVVASHSPRRNGSSKEKFMLKPLAIDQKTCPTGIHTTFSKDALRLSVASSAKVLDQVTCDRPDRGSEQPHSNYTSHNVHSSKVSTQVVSLGNCCDGNFSSQQLTEPNSLYSIAPPPPRISHSIGQKVTFGNPLGFRYHTEFVNLLSSQRELVATGTPVPTIIPKQTQAKCALRWQTKTVPNEKGSQYVDPMLGCSPGYHARMAEIAQYELDTVKWERSKKGRKKASSS